jgi:hypothetical protein
MRGKLMTGRCTCGCIATNHGGKLRQGACMQCDKCKRFIRDGDTRMREMLGLGPPPPPPAD